MGEVSVLRLELFKHSYGSFLDALDAEGVPHSEVQQFTTQPQASAFVESISALSEAMPWNSIAKIMIAWIEARKSREIIIATENDQVIYLKGYSVSAAEKIIKRAVKATVIDTAPNE